VGETSRSFEVRMREHLDKIRKHDRSQHINRHFNCDNQHKDAPLDQRVQFQIIEKMCMDDNTALETNLMRKRRTDRELYWISRLRTVFPLGLNDKISGFGISGNATSSKFKVYNPLSIENKIPKGHS